MSKKQQTESQQVVLSWGGDGEQRQAILYASLFQVAAHLTQICHPAGGQAEEVVGTFTKVYALLHDWYNGSSFKAEIKRMLDILLPNGHVPGNGASPTASQEPIDLGSAWMLPNGTRDKQTPPKARGPRWE
jgi:hypothetical protein